MDNKMRKRAEKGQTQQQLTLKQDNLNVFSKKDPLVEERGKEPSRFLIAWWNVVLFNPFARAKSRDECALKLANHYSCLAQECKNYEDAVRLHKKSAVYFSRACLFRLAALELIAASKKYKVISQLTTNVKEAAELSVHSIESLAESAACMEVSGDLTRAAMLYEETAFKCQQHAFMLKQFQESCLMHEQAILYFEKAAQLYKVMGKGTKAAASYYRVVKIAEYISSEYREAAFEAEDEGLFSLAESLRERAEELRGRAEKFREEAEEYSFC